MKRSLPKRRRDYLREQGACCKPSSIAGYRLVLRSFANRLNKPIASLTKDDLQNYTAQLCNRKLAAYTKVNYLLSVKKYLQWEVERGTLPEDLLSVLDRSKLPTVPEYLPRPLSTENDQRLQKALRESESPYAPPFLLLRHTGMRISELINLPKDCVLANGDEKYLKVPLGKMNTERLVPLTEGTLRTGAAFAASASHQLSRQRRPSHVSPGPIRHRQPRPSPSGFPSEIPSSARIPPSVEFCAAGL